MTRQVACVCVSFVILLCACQKPTDNYAQFLPSELKSHSQCPPRAIIIGDKNYTKEIAPIEVENFCVRLSFDILNAALSRKDWMSYEPNYPVEMEVKNLLDELNITGEFPTTRWDYRYQKTMDTCDLTLHVDQAPSIDWAPSKNYDTFVSLVLQKCEPK